MKPLTKHYLKTFLIVAIPFALGMAFLQWTSGNPINVTKLLLQMIFFGVLMTITLVYLQRTALQKNGIQNITEEHLQVRQQATLHSNLDQTALLQKIKSDPVLSKMTINTSGKDIILQSKPSWKSWGEKMTITVQSRGANGFEYQVTSQPRLWTTLFDYGKNLENVRRVSQVAG